MTRIEELPRFVAHQRVFHAEQVKDGIAAYRVKFPDGVNVGDWIVYGPDGPVILSNAMFRLFFAAIEA